MKSYFLLVVFSFSMLSLAAQKKLKMTVSASSDTVYSTSEQRLYVRPSSKLSISEHLKSTMYRSRRGFMLGFSIQTGRTNLFTISAGSIAEIRLSDGEKVFLETLGSRESKGSVLGYGSFTFTSYTLNRDQLEKLKNADVKSIRINTSAGNFDYEIKDKFASVIGDQVRRIENAF